MLLGCIADDYTGASDLANTLTQNGMRTVQFIGLPDKDAILDNVDAAVVSFKSRSIPAQDAVKLSLRALDWLQNVGCSQILFKYCSTFDSTPEGNIGPVAEALLTKLGASIAIACPAFPDNKRSIYQGHLFVGDKLLSESGMENHPLNPMRDANLVRVLQKQTKVPVGLIGFSIVQRGVAAVRNALAESAKEGKKLVVVDAVTNDHLKVIGAACADLPLITGGSGIAIGLPENFKSKGKLEIAKPYSEKVPGRAIILSGSCSQATLGQVENYSANNPYYKLDIERLLGLQDINSLVDEVTEWTLDKPESQVPLIFSSASPDAVSTLQSKYSAENVSQNIENFFGRLALKLNQRGVRRFIIAGGETSGSVINQLGVKAFHIGEGIDPGVPAMFSVSNPKTSFVLKSGNFGTVDFFSKAQKFI